MGIIAIRKTNQTEIEKMIDIYIHMYDYVYSYNLINCLKNATKIIHKTYQTYMVEAYILAEYRC